MNIIKLRDIDTGGEMEELQTARALYPRVSDIIGKQSEREMRQIPLETLLNASIRGTKIHAYCTAYLNGLWLPEIEEEYQPYFDAFVKWADENIFQTLSAGVRLYDDERRFSGEYDCIVILKNSKQIALLDLKTSSLPSKSWPIQLAAYKHLCDINEIDIEVVYNIHLKKTKSTAIIENTNKTSVKAVEIEHKNLNQYWDIFTSALECYDYFDRKEVKNV